MRVLASALMCALILGSGAGVPADELWRDDFTSPQAYETWGERCWTIEAGEARFRSGVGYARLVATLPDPSRATIRTRVTLTERTAVGSYVSAGLVVFLDPDNQWQLLLVENPTGGRYMDFVERFQGVHQAQGSGGTSRTRLTMEEAGELTTWSYGKPYEIELDLSPEAIVGTVTDPASGQFWRRSYSLTAGEAVKRGRPGIMATGFRGAFHELSVDGSLPVLPKGLPIKEGPAGSIAIIADEDGALGRQWADALRQAGFGATVVSWEQLANSRVPVEKIDLLLLADARRLPVQAREAVMHALRTQGKVMAIGAPAFSGLLVHTPQGWIGPEHYAETLLARIEPVPVAADQEDWRRSARFPERAAAVEVAPEEGAGCWKMSCDLDSWDGFAANVEGAFGADRTLLTFWARGDDRTSQLSVECREKDESRWIATVDLTTEWRAYVLRPHDFPYWQDSRSKNRGGTGDHFRPSSVSTITLGLSHSHTPKVGNGSHTFWVKGLATAVDPGDEDLDFSVPDVEALSPSYKLFPLRTPVQLLAGREQAAVADDFRLQWDQAAYSPVWRERGRGFDRTRSWRWVPVLEARDGEGWHRGALVSLMIGDAVYPNAIWANVGVAEPAAALDGKLKVAVLNTARAMVGGCFLLEGGAGLFSCEPGERLALGAEALNAGRAEQRLTLACSIGLGRDITDRRASELTVAAGKRQTVNWEWRAPREPGEYTVAVTLREDGRLCDSISHQLRVEAREEPDPSQFVRVEGSNFILDGKPRFFKGINYRPTWVGGYPHLNLIARECYDPEIVERDLSWLESIGVNAVSAIHALQPPDPDAPDAFRDQVDFLDRCERHGMKVFFFLPKARPFAGADPEWVKDYIERAGIKDHPAIMTWELAWEPILSTWGTSKPIDFMLEPWNDWVIERYGSTENAVADWGYEPQLDEDGKLPVPAHQMVMEHGPWDVMVAAFRRAFSDAISEGYRDIVTPLRAFDLNHLISFRFGACGIPNQHRFAHAHSVGVAKHIDFMNPEGYDLKTGGFASPTPPDDIRKGGLVTLYYRFVSREKPVVWMEFGYSVNGFHREWKPELVHIDPQELANQKAEYESFYSMFIESGARGAAPWWLPGGFRLGEQSDFGVVNEHGSERPVCQVLRKYLPRFDKVEHRAPTTYIDLDLDHHYPDAWTTYAPEYLRLIETGERPYLRTVGTGTGSATCPLTAVGGTEYNGHNPPVFLNAEFNSLEMRAGNGAWRPIRGGETVEVAEGQPVRCRASVGNIAEAAWLAPKGDEDGGVHLAGRAEYGLEFTAPIQADTPFLKDATVEEFVLVPKARGETQVSFEMMTRGRAYFGERRTVSLKAVAGG